MEINDLLLVLVLQTGVLLVLLWFLRYSNKKLIKEISDIEKNLQKLNEFIDKLSANQKRLRHEIKNHDAEPATASSPVAQNEPRQEKNPAKAMATIEVHSPSKNK